MSDALDALAASGRGGRLAELTFAYLDDRLDPAGAADLHALLAADPESAAEFARLCFRDGLLSATFRQTYHLAIDPRPAPDDGDLAPELALPEPARPARRRPRRRNWPRPMALAAGLAAAVVIAWQLAPPARPGPPRLARFDRAIGCDWDGRPPALGRELSPGEQFRLKDGVAELEFAGGVRVTLDGAADLTVVGPGRVRLDAGTLTADVPRAGRGFTVETPAGEVVDLGTWFRVRTTEPGKTDVDVFEGRVDISPTAAGSGVVRLTDGWAARFDRVAVAPPRPVVAKPVARRPFPGIVSADRQVKVVTAAPAVLTPDTFGQLLHLVPERTDHPLSADLTCSAPQTVNPLAGSGPTVALPRGRRVHSYLIQTGPGAAEGEIKFSTPVVGVISTGEQLVATDAELSPYRFSGWPADRRPSPGAKLESWLSADRLTLWLGRNATQADQVRVLLDASP